MTRLFHFKRGVLRLDKGGGGDLILLIVNNV